MSAAQILKLATDVYTDSELKVKINDEWIKFINPLFLNKFGEKHIVADLQKYNSEKLDWLVEKRDIFNADSFVLNDCDVFITYKLPFRYTKVENTWYMKVKTACFNSKWFFGYDISMNYSGCVSPCCLGRVSFKTELEALEQGLKDLEDRIIHNHNRSDTPKSDLPKIQDFLDQIKIFRGSQNQISMF